MTQSTEAILLGVFRQALGLDDGITPEMIRRDDLSAWDSVGHMELVSSIESTFGIEMDFDDVLSLDSFERALAVVTRHRG